MRKSFTFAKSDKRVQSQKLAQERLWSASVPKWACDILDKMYDEDDTFLSEYRKA